MILGVAMVTARVATPGAVPGSRQLPAYRPAILQSGSPPGSCWAM